MGKLVPREIALSLTACRVLTCLIALRGELCQFGGVRALARTFADHALELADLAIVIVHDLGQEQILLFDQKRALTRRLVADDVEQLLELVHAKAQGLLFVVGAREVSAQRVQLVNQLGVGFARQGRTAREMLQAAAQ